MKRPPFSLVMPYHDNGGMLAEHYSLVEAFPPEIKRAFEIVICDDASTTPAYYPRDTFGHVRDIGVPISIFRIPKPHVAWSHRVATNIAASNARGAFLLVTDIDHFVPLETWRYLVSGRDKPFLLTDRAYRFERRNMDGSAYKPHPDSWLFHVSVWNQIGGYDERYRGHYGQNMPFIERVNHFVKTDTLPVALVRYSRDDIADASERVLTRKTPEARAAIARLREQFRRDGTFFKDTRGSAIYERVKP